MLVFDEANNSITKQDLYGTDEKNGYWQGNLIHLPIGNGSGYLISLMSVMKRADVPWIDTDGDSGNFENGTAVSLKYIPMFDIDQGIWLEQQTTPIGWESEPEPRTRFCSALFYDAVNSTYDLWVHGGQRLSEQSEGVAEIYVLSMPSFTWTQVNTAYPQNNLIRSHTCHTVGGQLIIVGGYPTGIEVESNVTCDPDYIKVLAISEEDTVWTSSYRRNSTYRQPLSIQRLIDGSAAPKDGFVSDQLRLDFETVQTTQCPEGPQCSTKSGGPPTRIIIGSSVGGGIAVILLIGAVFFCVRRRRRREELLTPANDEIPFSPVSGRPPTAETQHTGFGRVKRWLASPSQ